MTKARFNLLFAFVIAFAAQAADTATTIYGVANGAVESNPTMAAVLNGGGYWGFIFVKLTAVFYFTALSFWNKTAATIMALPFFYFAVHNLQVIATL